MRIEPAPSDPKSTPGGDLGGSSNLGGSSGGAGRSGAGNQQDAPKTLSQELAQLDDKLSIGDSDDVEGGNRFGVHGGANPNAESNEAKQAAFSILSLGAAIIDVAGIAQAVTRIVGKVAAKVTAAFGTKGIEEATEAAIKQGAKEGVQEAVESAGKVVDDFPKRTGAEKVALGAEREQRVAKLVNGEVSRKIVKTPFGATDIDVVDNLGQYISVGGPAKAKDLAKLGNHLKRLQWLASEGKPVKMAFERGTPQQAIDLAVKWLGRNNVFIF